MQGYTKESVESKWALKWSRRLYNVKSEEKELELWTTTVLSSSIWHPGTLSSILGFVAKMLVVTTFVFSL